MKILIVVESKCNGSTLKVAKAMAEVAPVTLTNTEGVKNYDLHDFDIVGFGSGIYAGQHDKRIVNLVKSLCDKKAYSFVFSTSGGTDFEKNNKPLVNLLKNKNKVVLGNFGCKGFNTFAFLKLIGGLNKGCPKADDLANAQRFIKEIISEYEKES